MATKADFTPEEWDTLEYAVADAMAYAAIADPGFWDSFKEANASARFIAEQRNSPSALVRDLSSNIRSKRDPNVADNPTTIADQAVQRISAGVALVGQKAPDELDAFKTMVLGVAEAAAEAAKGVSANETTAIDRIKAALG